MIQRTKYQDVIIHLGDQMERKGTVPEKIGEGYKVYTMLVKMQGETELELFFHPELQESVTTKVIRINDRLIIMSL